jgi:hypothetical protein
MENLTALFVLALLILVSSIASSQTRVEWKEKDNFHGIMSETFHPAEEGDFGPIRTRSGEMVEKAIAWQKSAIPAEFANVAGIQDNLSKLVAGSEALNTKIKANCTDEEIKIDLTALHDIFHSVVGLCKTNDK